MMTFICQNTKVFIKKNIKEYNFDGDTVLTRPG